MPAPAAGKAPLTAYVRTLNEARGIAEVVRAAARVADEVIVIDSGSTDGTPALAAAEGARVIAQDWLGQGLQKRAGEAAARHDWLLDLDADEVLSEPLIEEIRALFRGGEPPAPVYALRLVIVAPSGRVWRGFSESRRAKLYDRRRLRMPAHRRWDQLELPPGLAAVPLRGELRHHAWDSLATLAAKANAASTRGAEHSRLKSRPVLVLRVLFGLPFHLLRHVVLRGRWRGGLEGVTAGVVLGVGRWLRDAKMLEIHARRRAAERGARDPDAG